VGWVNSTPVDSICQTFVEFFAVLRVAGEIWAIKNPPKRVGVWFGKLFPVILFLRGLFGLPLHIARSVRAAALERNDVIYDVSRATASRFAGGWAWVGALEVFYRAGAALDAAITVARAGVAAWGCEC